MKNMLRITALGCAVAFATNVSAHDAKPAEANSGIIKASYSLPKKDGDDFRATIRESDQENAQLKQQIAADHADLYDLITASDFDRKAFLSKTQELRKLEEQAKENRDDAFSSAVAELSQSERVTLANSLASVKDMGSVHHKHKHVASNSNSSGSNSGNNVQDAAPSAGGDNSTAQ